jgi:hypothetical protein
VDAVLGERALVALGEHRPVAQQRHTAGAGDGQVAREPQAGGAGGGGQAQRALSA